MDWNFLFFGIMESVYNVFFKMLVMNLLKWEFLNCIKYIGINDYVWKLVINVDNLFVYSVVGNKNDYMVWDY